MKQFLILASTFIFASCVDIERGNPEDPGSRNYNVNRLSSSLSVEVSSSSEPSSSSSSVPQSSSSVVASSSSVVESSSSSMLSSSSSALPSSSSVEPSSSSVVEYSSSSMLSSSSSALSSSSSVAASSSSAAVSSSSSMLSSSSSALPSSSSVATSSSSVALSSSSVCTANDNTETHYCSNGTMKKYGSVTDDDGQTYKTVEIGTQIWMAENLNYNVPSSLCYDDDTGGDSQGNCAIYGRLYNWATAMGNSNASDNVPSGVRGVCPEGWHLPSDAEWSVLMKFVSNCSGSSICFGAGTRLKATNGWTNNGTGDDKYGFSALPGGNYYGYGYFSSGGSHGCWWSTSDGGGSLGSADYRYMTSASESVHNSYSGKSNMYSVRCIRD